FFHFLDEFFEFGPRLNFVAIGTGEPGLGKSFSEIFFDQLRADAERFECADTALRALLGQRLGVAAIVTDEMRALVNGKTDRAVGTFFDVTALPALSHW